MQPSPGARPGRARGAGLLGTVSGFGVFLLLLFFAVHVCVGLYTRSMVTSAAYDAARTVAGYRSAADRENARAIAETEFRRRLGGLGTDRVQLEWLRVDDPDAVHVHVVAEHPTMLPGSLTGAMGVGRTDRVLDVRIERPR